MNKTWHPDDSQLTPWVDGELEGTEADLLDRHVAECAECARRAAEVRAVYESWNRRLRSTLPPPPEPWPSLSPRLREFDRPPVVIRNRPRFRVPVWAAAAAAVAIGFFVVRVTTGGSLSAAELLRDASAAEIRAIPAKQIRVKTRSAVFTRPASKGIESELATLFRKANYSWEEPLSARAFASWRQSLREKNDQVRVLRDGTFGAGRFYRITTTTTDSELAEASITFRAEDLRAVHERLTFRNAEWVEITEAQEQAEPSSKPLPPVQIAEEPKPNREITAADELRVVAALHAIGADLGDPVEVRPESDRILVSTLISNPEKQSELRAALSGLPFVELRFEKPEAVRKDEASLDAAQPEGPKANAIVDRLTVQLGSRSTVENFTNHVLDLSEAALARAHALRALAVRFSPEREATLPAADRSVLQKIEATHARHLLASVRQLSEVLQPVAQSQSTAPAPDSYPTWQSAADAVLDSARRLDRIVTNTLAGAGTVDDPSQALQRLAAATVDLNARAAALQTTVAASGAR